MPHVLHLLVPEVKFETHFVLMQQPVSNDNSGTAGICINFNSFLPYFVTLNRNKTLKYVLHEAKLSFICAAFLHFTSVKLQHNPLVNQPDKNGYTG